MEGWKIATAYTITRVNALPQSQKPQKARFNCDIQAVTVHPTLRHSRRASGPSPCQDNWRFPRKCSPSICVASMVALWVVVGNCVWSLCLRTESWVAKASGIVGGTKSRQKRAVRKPKSPESLSNTDLLSRLAHYRLSLCLCQPVCLHNQSLCSGLVFCLSPCLLLGPSLSLGVPLPLDSNVDSLENEYGQRLQTIIV